MFNHLIDKEWPIKEGYTIKVVKKFKEPQFSKMVEQVFNQGFPSLNLQKYMDEDELEIANSIDAHSSSSSTSWFRLGIYKSSQLIGWSFGWKTSKFSFYIASSAILPEHRNKGLYTALLKQIISLLSDIGFQRIDSRHVATNNAVLIPKLKAGFNINGLELSEEHGLLVRLSYYIHPMRQELINYRSGLDWPMKVVEKYFNPDN